MIPPDLPKAELHVHLEGTIGPALARRLAARNGLEVPAERLTADGSEWAWDGFLDFLRCYDAAAATIRTGEDVREVVREYLLACAAEGAVYVELIASLDHGREVGLDDEEHLAGIAAGIDDAHARTGIVGRVLSSFVRHLGAEAAEDVARRTLAIGHPYVVGINLGGDEAGFEPRQFARAYAMCHEAGLGCSVHAGEHAGPESVRAALELPGITRISHGVRAAEDPALVAELAERGIVLEVCPTSNLATGVYGSWAEHPLGRLRDAGVRVTLGSDDPPFFGTSIGREYEVAAEHLGLGPDELAEVTDIALDAAFAAPDVIADARSRRPTG